MIHKCQCQLMIMICRNKGEKGLINPHIFNISGVILLTMSFLGGTPVECTLHPSLWNSNQTMISAEDEDYDDDDEPPDLMVQIQSRNLTELVI